MSVSKNVLVLAVLGVLVSGACAWGQPAEDMAIAGKRVAERNCGGCHAVGAGVSPLADAPPFRDIHDRYRAGGLSELLREGMLAPATPPEEGSPRGHPRMPMVSLGPDEVDELKAYLHSFEPTPEPRERRSISR